MHMYKYVLLQISIGRNIHIYPYTCINLYTLDVQITNWKGTLYVSVSNTLQHTATHCNTSTLQYTATHCNTLHTYIFSAPAAWVQGLFFDACFKCVVLFCHPYYLSKTSPLSIHVARNSRIWQMYCKEHTFELEKSLKSYFFEFEAWIEKIG